MFQIYLSIKGGSKINKPRFNLFYLILFCFFCTSIYGQDLILNTQNGLPPNFGVDAIDSNPIYETMEDQLSTEYFETVFPLDFSHEGSKLLYGLRDFIEGAATVSVDQIQSQAILQDQKEFINLSLPVGIDRTIQFALSKKDILTDDFRLTDSEGNIHSLDASSCSFYQGVVKNSPGSLAAFSFSPAGVRGLAADNNGNYVLGKLFDYENINIFYNDRYLKERQDFSCALDERFGAFKNKPELNGLSAKIEKQLKAGGECIGIYIECDYSIYQRFDFSVDKVFDYVTALFNEVALFYARENVKIQISDIYVWTSPDPYLAYSSSFNVLDLFGERTQNNFDGNLAHLLTTRNLGHGGLAWLDVICDSYESYIQDWDGDGIAELHHRGPYGISTVISTNVVPFSTYSWDVFVLAHELGHNFGSPHTHACNWGPNGDQALDNCFTPEDNCGFGPEPVNGGTIMSYCNVTDYGMNFDKGLGVEPGNLIRSRVNAANCLFECPCNLEVAFGNTVFTNYSWLNNYVQPDNCNNEFIQVFDAGGSQFVYVKDNIGAKLYYQDGTFYCSDNGNGDCLNTYNLSKIDDSWTCNSNDNACDGVGCTDTNACNYNPNATQDDGSCNYGESGCASPCNAIKGCTNPSASNYNPQANCDDGTCDTSNPACNNDIFTKFPWVSTIVNQSSCSTEKVTVYNMISYYFIYIEDNNGSRLYYQNGTLYCTTSSIYNCLEVYNASQIDFTWDCAQCSGNGGCITGCGDPSALNYNPNATCPDQILCEYNDTSGNCNQSNLFNQFAWLNNEADENNCTNETIYEYDNGAYSFLYIVKNGVGKFYYENGTFYCQDSGDFSCPESYNYTSSTGCWSCGSTAACGQYAGTVFYDLCEDGQYYYFIELDNGLIVDPYNAPGVEFDYPNGVSVNFNYVPANFNSPCSVASQAVTITCIEADIALGCTDEAACNYNPAATVSNGTCDYACYSCNNNSGTVFYDLCEDGQYYYFIETDQGLIFDPYNASGIEFDYPNGINVSFDYVPRGSSPCSIADQAVTITCIQGNFNIDVFADFPFLNSKVNQSNCNNTQIRVYDFGTYSFVAIDYGSYTELYYEDGTFYCNNCETSYQLNNPSYTWNCAPASKKAASNQAKAAPSSNRLLVDLYPNPSSGIFNIQTSGIDHLSNGQIYIYNTQGQTLKQFTINNTFTTIDISDLGSGLYWLAIKSEKFQQTQKIMIQ